MTPKIPLRERKFIQTKLKLARALRTRLEQDSLEALNVRELCEQVEVSEATFFNYFPKKSDLLAYLGQLWSVELAWQGRHAMTAGAGLSVIQAVFEYTAQQVQSAPNAMGELMAWQARQRMRQMPAPLSESECRLAFPDVAGIEPLPEQGLESLFAENLRYAIEQGELPDNIPLQTVMVSLIALFYGVPLALRLTQPSAIGSMYKQQLTILWAGMRSVTARVVDTAQR